MSPVAQRIQALLDLPRGRQLQAANALRAELAHRIPDEAWNTRFGPESLFDAWTRSTVVRRVHTANAERLREQLQPGFEVLEIGGGDGRLWSQVLGPEATGRLHLIDPAPEVHEQVRRQLPEGVELVSLCHPVEAVLASLPQVEHAVLSLTLHHVAGRDAEERARHGLSGPGKLEILQALKGSVLGTLVVNEADVFCELALPPEHPQLYDHLLDSYLRRCGRSLLEDLRTIDDPGRARRVEAILHRWCLDQLAAGALPVAERDVYELDVERWQELFERAGWRLETWRFTDPWRLFARYELR